MTDQSTNMSNDKSHVEAWKSVIDFSKGIISLAASILTAFIGFLVLENLDFSLINLVAPSLLFISIVLSLIGFGQAISSIKHGISKKNSILYTNLGAYLLAISIPCLAFITVKEKSHTIDQVLLDVEKSTRSFPTALKTKNCVSIELADSEYTIKYFVNDTTEVIVLYADDKGKVTSIK